MSEHDPKDLPPQAEDDDVEAHLLKESLAAGAIAASMFAGAAASAHASNQMPGSGTGAAVVVDPGAGGGLAQVGNPGGGGSPGQVGNPGGGGSPGQVTDPGGGSGLAKKHAPAKPAKPKSKTRAHHGSSKTSPPQKPPLQPEG